MAIVVSVRAETGDNVSEARLWYRPLVSWAHRSAFPHLGHVDPYGDTVFNRSQAESLQQELVQIAAVVASHGAEVFVQKFGAETSDPESGVSSPPAEEWIPTLVAALEEMCVLTTLRPHRYLWFSGD
jgi:hypothetical protein